MEECQAFEATCPTERPSFEYMRPSTRQQKLQKNNKEKLEKVKGEEVGLALIVEHEVNVAVRKSNGLKNQSMEKIILEREIFLIDVGCNLLSSFGIMGSLTTPDKILSYMPNAIRSAFTIAIFIRNIIIQVIHRMGGTCVGETTEDGEEDWLHA